MDLLPEGRLAALRALAVEPQMAEGWARHLKGDCLEAYSAGIETHGLNPHAVQVMAEAGVDIGGQLSQHVDELSDVPLDLVVTVCGHAHENCPVFSGDAKVPHVGFDDPPRLATDAGEIRFWATNLCFEACFCFCPCHHH